MPQFVKDNMPKTREEELWQNTFTLEKRNSDKILQHYNVDNYADLGHLFHPVEDEEFIIPSSFHTS